MKVLALLTLAALTIQSCHSACLNFNGATEIKLSNDLSGGVINVSLNEKPAGQVTVYYDAQKSRFDRCAVQFNPSNWNQPQSIRVIPEPYSTLATSERNVPITFQAWSDDCSWKFQGVTETLNTVRQVLPEGRCYATGDPHYTTFDTPGTYHYMGQGTFYLIQSDILTVQVIQRRCFNRPTCIVAVAVRYGGAVFIIDGTRSNINDYVQAVTHTNGVTISRSRCSTTNTINVGFNSGSSIKMDFITGANLYTNVYINLGTYLRGRVKGLCGTYDGNSTNDFVTPNGIIYTPEQIFGSCNPDAFNDTPKFPKSPLYAFGESWRVPDNDNIFLGVKTPNKLPLDTAVNQCLRPQPSSIKCVNTAPQFVEPSPCLEQWQSSWAYSGCRRRRAVIPNTSQDNNAANLPSPMAVADIPSGFQEQSVIPEFDGRSPSVPVTAQSTILQISTEVVEAAAQMCPTKIVKIEACNDEQAWITAVENCKIDIRGQANPDAMYNLHNSAYTEACARQLLSMAQEPDPTVSAAAREAVLAQSFGNAECDPQCLQCVDRGCAQCRDPVKYEIKAGRCELKSSSSNISNELFSPPPAQILLSRSEIAPQISTSEALGQTHGNIAVNPQAIISQDIGDGPQTLI